jgi:hypothetical protein
MFDLVLWSFVMALTPPLLGFAWKLLVGVGAPSPSSSQGSCPSHY